jgi:hypothetical protein
MKFTKDVAVFAATVATVFAQIDLTAPIENGCYEPAADPYAIYGWDEVLQFIDQYQSIADSARSAMNMKLECRLDAMTRLQQLTNDVNADPANYLISE